MKRGNFLSLVVLAMFTFGFLAAKYIEREGKMKNLIQEVSTCSTDLAKDRIEKDTAIQSAQEAITLAGEWKIKLEANQAKLAEANNQNQALMDQLAQANQLLVEKQKELDDIKPNAEALKSQLDIAIQMIKDEQNAKDQILAENQKLEQELATLKQIQETLKPEGLDILNSAILPTSLVTGLGIATGAIIKLYKRNRTRAGQKGGLAKKL